MATTFYERAANTILPPSLSGAGYNSASGANVIGNSVSLLACTSTSGSASLGVASVTGQPANAGKNCYVTFQALSSGGAIYIVLKKGTAGATLTTTTGWEIPSGGEKHFCFNSAVVDSVEAICASGVTGTLKWYTSSFQE